MNHGKEETRFQKSLISRRKHHVCMEKTIRFWSRNQHVLISSLIIKKYFHHAPEGVKLSRINKQYELNSKLNETNVNK